MGAVERRLGGVAVPSPTQGDLMRWGGDSELTGTATEEWRRGDAPDLTFGREFRQ